MKYLVLEVHTSYAIVLDEKGNFLMAANMGYTTGQNLEHVELLESAAPNRSAGMGNTRRVVAFVAAIAACLMFFLVSALQPQVYATVIMSINPKLQLDLNRNGGVVRVIGLNEEGKAIAEKMSMQTGEPVEVAVSDITDNAIRDGYLKNNGEVEMLVETSDTQFYRQMEETLEKSVKETIDDRVAAVHVKVDKKEPQISPSPTHTATPSDAPTASGAENMTINGEGKPAMVDIPVPLNSPVVGFSLTPTPTPTPSPSPTFVPREPSPTLLPLPTPSPSPKGSGISPTPTSTPIQTPPPTENDKDIIPDVSVPPVTTPTPTPTFLPRETPSFEPISDSPSPSIQVEVSTAPTPQTAPTPTASTRDDRPRWHWLKNRI